MNLSEGLVKGSVLDAIWAMCAYLSDAKAQTVQNQQNFLTFRRDLTPCSIQGGGFLVDAELWLCFGVVDMGGFLFNPCVH